MKKMRGMATVLAGAALCAGSLALAAAPADAAPRTPLPYYNCGYPYVCLYNSTVDIVVKFRDVTSGWQSFDGTNVYYGLNTRKDDVAYIRYTDGGEGCLPAGDPMALYDIREYGVPNGIRIDTSAVCWPNTPKLKKAAAPK
jgi:hypothetical protein